MSPGKIFSNTLTNHKGAKMSPSQAAAFASKYEVVDQFNSSTGASATIFKNRATGEVSHPFEAQNLVI
jgi:hypothetical protein